jgi:hypothetical protein
MSCLAFNRKYREENLFDAKDYARLCNLTKSMIKLAIGGLVQFIEKFIRMRGIGGRGRRSGKRGLGLGGGHTRKRLLGILGEQEETHVLIVYHFIITIIIIVLVILVSSRGFLFFESNLLSIS